MADQTESDWIRLNQTENGRVFFGGRINAEAQRTGRNAEGEWGGKHSTLNIQRPTSSAVKRWFECCSTGAEDGESREMAVNVSRKLEWWRIGAAEGLKLER